MKIHIALLFTICSFFLSAQNHTDNISQIEAEYKRDSIERFVNVAVPPDSIDVARLEKKSFWRASAETVGFNVGLWAFDRFALKGHYAYINWNTIKENFKHGFEWDNDHLSTNMFAHPYNGSIFYNAGRSNGFNYWQSELFAIGGSAMWELFMECEYPSTNDIIATPVGGAAIGEVLYRTSDLVLDDRATGGKRFGRELAAFLISPMRGINRIVTGRAWEKRPTSGRHFGIPPISIAMSLGTRLLVFQDADNLTKAGAAARVSIEYGDRFASKTKAPYDYFSFLMELNAMKTQPLLSRVEIIGRLLSREVIDSNSDWLSVGMYQHFDYFDSDTIGNQSSDDKTKPCIVPYKLGTPASVGGGLMFRHTEPPQWNLDAYIHVNGVLLGGVLSDFYRYYHRNYNWSSGFSSKVGINLNLYKYKLSMTLANQIYRLYTWGGYDHRVDWSETPAGKPVNIQGDSSRATFSHLEFTLNYRLWENLYASLGLDWFYRKTEYDRYDTYHTGTITWSSDKLFINSHQSSLHLMLTYSF